MRQPAGTGGRSGSAGRAPSERWTDSEREGGLDAFPWFVTLVCLLVGLVVFIQSTRPALAEQEELIEVQEQLEDTLEAEHQALEKTRQRREALGADPESVLVELDGQGISPAEADDRAYAARRAAEARDGPRDGQGAGTRR